MAAKKILVFDTETTGLPPRKTDLNNSAAWEKCRMVQIAWEVYNGTSLESSYCAIIKPDGYEIPYVSSTIHGITTDVAKEKGIPLHDAFDELMKVLPSVNVAVAHNIRFDDDVLQSEMLRYGLHELHEEWKTKEKVCTMRMALTTPNQKWPKLSELYFSLFNAEPQGKLHTADVDVATCAKCYFKMMSGK